MCLQAQGTGAASTSDRAGALDFCGYLRSTLGSGAGQSQHGLLCHHTLPLCCVRLVLRGTDRLLSRWLSSFIAREELNTMTTKLNSRQSPPDLSGTGSKNFLVSFRESYIRI